MSNNTILSNHIKELKYSLTPDVIGFKIVFVNVYMIGEPREGGKWILVDAGLQGYAGKIKAEAEALYGKNTKPEAIILTHGHFDHVGALPELLKDWDGPVYAHPLEEPYLTGKSSYPPADPGVGGGTMAYMSWMFPSSPINISNNLHLLPKHGHVPHLDGWKYIHTPGNAPGHISLFRESDRTLIAGDAITTVNQSSASAVYSQKQELLGPPHYFTIDWENAQDSVNDLADLEPFALGSGHGLPMFGEKLKHELNNLSENFEQVALPKRGRYLKYPAYTDKNGIISMPTPVSSYVAKGLAVLFIGVIISTITYSILKNKNN